MTGGSVLDGAHPRCAGTLWDRDHDFADEVICDEKGYIANWLGVKDQFSGGVPVELARERLRPETATLMRWSGQSPLTFASSVAFR